MRRFIVVKRFQETETGNIKVTLDMYDRESFQVLLNDLKLQYNPPNWPWDKDAEEAAISDVNEWNGDGDIYYRISEIVGDHLNHLIF